MKLIEIYLILSTAIFLYLFVAWNRKTNADIFCKFLLLVASIIGIILILRLGWI